MHTPPATKKQPYRAFWSDLDQRFVAQCIANPSLMTHGRSRLEAISQLQQLIDELPAHQRRGLPMTDPQRQRLCALLLKMRLAKPSHPKLAVFMTDKDLEAWIDILESVLVDEAHP